MHREAQRTCIHKTILMFPSQVDLRYECRALEKFIDNFVDNPNIRFPRPIRPYCKRDVLVESFEVNFLADND